MVRDFDLIRNILIEIENAPASDRPIQQLSFDAQVDDATVSEHLELMIEADLIDGKVISHNPAGFIIKRLTWLGHDFLEHARNDTIWKKVISQAKAKGSSVTLHVLNGLLTKAAEKYAGV